MKFPLPYEFPRTEHSCYPSVPFGIRLYVIGDIHGRLDLLNECLSQIDRDIAEHNDARSIQIFLGDYVDRGPFSRGTLDRLIERSADHECIFLKGNHEDLLLRSLSDISLFPKWIHVGGLETLVSYGVAATTSTRRSDLLDAQASLQKLIPASHLRFLEGLKTHFSCGSYFFTHAGVRPGIELSKQLEKDLLWIRDEFLNSKSEFGSIVVHGHTPTSRIDVRFNQINVDTGAYASDLLSGLVLHDEQLFGIDSSKN